QQFDSLELEAAVKEYNKALKIIEKNIALSNDMKPLTNAMGMIGAGYLLLGQAKRARGMLEKLLVVAPDFHPDRSIFNPNMMQELNTTGSKVKAMKVAKLAINVDHIGSSVFLDGRFAGVAPVNDFQVQKGRHFVRIE